jgi:hypothetical protein
MIFVDQHPGMRRLFEQTGETVVIVSVHVVAVEAALVKVRRVKKQYSPSRGIDYQRLEITTGDPGLSSAAKPI